VSKSLDAVTIPKWGIEMTQGTIVAWHKAEGDTVKAGEEIVDIETDKIVNSFEARSSGTLVRILAEVGEELPVGYLIGVIASEVVTDDAIEAFIAAQISDEETVSEEETNSASPEVHIAKTDRASATRIAPALRRKLERAGIDPEQIEGSGPEGRITKEDVDRAIG
jgi:pyruvate dehydrogenase E2 component (dihydrolipoamide acetyltransferase)